MVESRRLNEYINSDQYEIVDQHPNARGDVTVVFANKESGERKTFPNVNPEHLKGSSRGSSNMETSGGNRSESGGSSGGSKRVFASMPKEEVREIASKGGKASGSSRH